MTARAKDAGWLASQRSKVANLAVDFSQVTLCNAIHGLARLRLVVRKCQQFTHCFWRETQVQDLLNCSGLRLQTIRNLDAVALQRGNDLACPFELAPKHGSAAIDWPAITVYPHDIDVGSALRLAFFED